MRVSKFADRAELNALSHKLDRPHMPGVLGLKNIKQTFAVAVCVVVYIGAADIQGSRFLLGLKHIRADVPAPATLSSWYLSRAPGQAERGTPRRNNK